MVEFQWYYSRGDQQRGPVSATELRHLATAGELSPDDFVWREGMDEWAVATKVKGLFPDSPPPAPPTTPSHPAEPVAHSPTIIHDPPPPVEPDVPSVHPAPARRTAGKSSGSGAGLLFAVQATLWGICVLVILVGTVMYTIAFRQAETAMDEAAAGATFSTFFIGAYVIARAGEKVAHLVTAWNQRRQNKTR